MLAGGCGGRTTAATSSSGTCVPLLDAGTDGTPGADAEPDAGTPPSCAPGGPGMTNCGPGGSGTESCCTSLEVTGGTYYRTYGNLGPHVVAANCGATGEADPATVSAFRLDKYLVTLGRFRQFVNAVLPPDGGTGWLPAAGSGKHAHLNGGLGLVNAGADDAGVAYEPGWVATDDVDIAPTNTNLDNDQYCTWTPSAGGDENVPISCVPWQEAYAFCIWDGGFLPSEAEWEYAAAGGNQQRVYPWGSTDPGADNQYAIYACTYPVPPDSSFLACTGAANIAPVGTAALGAGLWGQLDLVGNLFEWNLDWYAADFVDPCTDCAYLPSAPPPSPPPLEEPGRVARGGSGLSNLWTAACTGFLPAGGNVLGFRCARTP